LAPNDIVADGALSIIAHELAETVVNPEEDAWLDVRNLEIADKCNVMTLNIVLLWQLSELQEELRWGLL
jgi:hypothetical protein